MKEDIIEAILALIIVAILIALMVVGTSGSPSPKPPIDKNRRTLQLLLSKPHAEELLLKRQGQWT